MQSIRMAKIFGDKVDPRVRLHTLFDGEPSRTGQPPERALEWAATVLDRAAAGDPSATFDTMTATRAFREAEPALTLKAATFLAAHAAPRRATGPEKL